MLNEIESTIPFKTIIDHWELYLIPKKETIIIYIVDLNTYEIFGEEFTIDLLHKNRLLLSSRTIKEIFDFICALKKRNEILIKDNKNTLCFVLKSTVETIPNVELNLNKKKSNSEEVIKYMLCELLQLRNERKEEINYKKEIDDLKEELLLYKKKLEEIEKKIVQIENRKKIQLETCNLHLLNTLENTHSKLITSIQVFPCGNFISVSKDKSIGIYDNIHFTQLQKIPNAHNKGIAYVSIKDDFNFITSSADCDIKIWIKKMNFEFELFHKIENAHSDKIGKIIYCENDNIISCSKDGTIKIWEKKHIIMKILIYLMKK